MAKSGMMSNFMGYGLNHIFNATKTYIESHAINPAVEHAAFHNRTIVGWAGCPVRDSSTAFFVLTSHLISRT